ncbi:MAG: hypothetical protein GXY53_04265 [Desulfobulbus sp.]|nr:hypothetical protein [Desulfobulbus sp.]
MLTAAGTALYNIPPSLQDIGRAVQSAVSKISIRSAGQSPAEPVLRGTVYDRNWRELAVSYQLFSVVINPAELLDRQEAAEKLAGIFEEKSEQLAARMKNAQDSFVIKTDVDRLQAEKIRDLQLQGVTCEPEEVRFYPGHAAASHVLGFMGDGVGLAGVEGKYDAVLRPGGFRDVNLPDIDFQGQQRLGISGSDLVLTLDIDLQKQVEGQFRSYLATTNGIEKGMALLLEPGSGRILALVNQPSFNPNYFWKASESNRVNRIYNHVLSKELIRPVLARAAAIEREGIEGPALLPATVAAPDYGFSADELDVFEHQIQLYGSVFGNWESGPGVTEGAAPEAVVTGVQVGVTLASLVNGGWRITPYVVDSVYDYETSTRYVRKGDATEKIHVLDPALGVKIRRELFTDWISEKEDLMAYTADYTQIRKEEGLTHFSVQDLFVGFTPAKQPRYLLLIAVEQDYLNPQDLAKHGNLVTLEQMGKELLGKFTKTSLAKSVLDRPPARSMENMRQFFISKRLNFKEASGKTAEAVPRMPKVRGLSLRKGLQELDRYNLRMRINGSGRIIAQYPLPGQSLKGIEECVLTLEPR